MPVAVQVVQDSLVPEAVVDVGTALHVDEVLAADDVVLVVD